MHATVTVSSTFFCSSALLLDADPVSPNNSELTHRYGAHDVRVSHTLAQAGTRGDQGGRLKAHMSIEQQRGIRWRGLRRLYTGARCCRLRWGVLGARGTERGAWSTGRQSFGTPGVVVLRGVYLFFYTWWGAIVDGAGDHCVSVRPSCAPHRASYSLTVSPWRIMV